MRLLFGADHGDRCSDPDADAVARQARREPGIDGEPGGKLYGSRGSRHRPPGAGQRVSQTRSRPVPNRNCSCVPPLTAPVRIRGRRVELQAPRRTARAGGAHRLREERLDEALVECHRALIRDRRRPRAAHLVGQVGIAEQREIRAGGRYRWSPLVGVEQRRSGRETEVRAPRNRQRPAVVDAGIDVVNAAAVEPRRMLDIGRCRSCSRDGSPALRVSCSCSGHPRPGSRNSVRWPHSWPSTASRTPSSDACSRSCLRIAPRWCWCGSCSGGTRP